LTTKHRIIYNNSEKLNSIDDTSIDLVVTSPPYPMIEMWDNDFMKLNNKISNLFNNKDYTLAFELMHQELDKIWTELFRVVKDGGIVCINIGDATRTLNENFKLFSSHSRIISKFIELGFQNLPNIIWRKTTNAPNKFMGSGMLPPGAYVTLEHEYILIFRKGNKRTFKTETEKNMRRESAYFWEERNLWFSDVWFDLNGTTQNLNNKELRKRSAAYPFELAYRLINMFSIKGDIILDPFLGTGTTTFATMTAERNSIGYEIDESFKDFIELKISQLQLHANRYVYDRIQKHKDFVKKRISEGKDFKFEVITHDFPCISKQEASIIVRALDKIENQKENSYKVTYKEVNKISDLLNYSNTKIKTINKNTIKNQEILNFN
jgi:DNA modification methylase